MSGGYFNSTHHAVNHFRDELDHASQLNHVERCGVANNFPPEVIQALQVIVAHVGVGAKLMRAAEDLYEGDLSPDSFMARFKEIVGPSA